MAENHAKHPRDEAEFLEFESSSSKRQRPYSKILSFLEEEEDTEEQQDPNQDLSAMFTTLQRELSFSSENSTTVTANFEFDSLPYTAEEYELTFENHLTSGGGGGVEDESVESVMRHLLEASDDELGIPNRGEDIAEVNSADNLPFAATDGLWDLENEAYNYLSELQSELFM